MAMQTNQGQEGQEQEDQAGPSGIGPIGADLANFLAPTGQGDDENTGDDVFGGGGEDGEFEEQDEQGEFDPTVAPACPLSDAECLAWSQAAWNSADGYFGANIRQRFTRNEAQARSKHLSGSRFSSTFYNDRFRFFVPKTAQAVNDFVARGKAAFLEGSQKASFKALDTSNQDQVNAAKLVQALMNLRMSDSFGPNLRAAAGTLRWAMNLEVSLRNAAKHNFACAKAIWNPHGGAWDKKSKTFMGEPRIYTIEPENIRFDAGCDWSDPINSSPYLIERFTMTVDEVMQKIKAGDWRDMSPEEIAAARDNSSLDDAIKLQRERSGSLAKKQPIAIDMAQRVTIHCNIIRVDGFDYVFYTLRNFKILSDPLPIKDVFLINMRPYVIGRTDLDGTNYPASMVEQSSGQQGILNVMANLRLDNLDQFASPKWAVERGNTQADIGALRSMASGSSIYVNRIDGIKLLETRDGTSAVRAETQQQTQEIDQMFGVYNGAQAIQGGDQPTTGNIQQVAMGNGLVLDGRIGTFASTFAAPILSLVAEYERTLESDPIILGVAGQTAGLVQGLAEEKQQLGLLTTLLKAQLQMNVQVGLGATNPEAQFQNLVMGIVQVSRALPQVQGRFDPDKVVSKMMEAYGERDGSSLLLDPQQVQQQNQQIQDLQNQVQDLQQKLAAKKPDYLLQAEADLTAAKADNARATTAKIKVDTAYGAMEAGAQVAAAPIIATIGDKILQSAGYDGAGPASPVSPSDAGGAPAAPGDPNASGPAGASQAVPPVQPVAPVQGQQPTSPVAPVSPEAPVKPVAPLAEQAKKEAAAINAQPKNNNPLTPRSPFGGVNHGIEGGK